MVSIYTSDSAFRNNQMDNINVCLFETWVDP